jgi:cysteine desulfurase
MQPAVRADNTGKSIKVNRRCEKSASKCVNFMVFVEFSRFLFTIMSMYLDTNATTPIAEEVWQVMMPWLKENFHNPSSSSRGGKKAREAIENARSQVASLLGAREEEIIFTSGGTEALNTAIRSLDQLCGQGDFLTSAVEHSAVLRSGEQLSRAMVRCGVDRNGEIKWDAYEAACEHAAFVSIMAANNETGVIMDWSRAATMAHDRGLPFLCDAVQAIGKIPISLAHSAVDFMAISAHKFHGPKGTGALFARRGCRFQPLLFGGGQENGLRSGTENVAGIVGMGAAAALAQATMAAEGNRHLCSLRDTFEQRVMNQSLGVIRNGAEGERLPNTSHLSFEGCEGAGLIILLDDKSVNCSTGSACMAGKQKPSHVQIAMGINETQAKSSLRFSFSRYNTLEEVSKAADLVVQAVAKLRSVQGHGVGPVVVYTP